MQVNPAVKMDDCHYELIRGVGLALKPKRILELGIGSAVGTEILLQVIRSNGIGELVAVDNWHDWQGKKPDGLPVAQELTIVELDEERFVRNTFDRFDLIVSDGDHFKSDQWVDHTLGLLTRRGVAFFHDVANPEFPNLRKVEQFVRDEGYCYRLFEASSRNDERCERGLLMVLGK